MPPSPSVVRMSKAQKAETEIAVLQVQVENIENKINELKADNKAIVDTIKSNHAEIHQLLKEMKTASGEAHANLSSKVTALEKWRWMMMGAGIVLGTMGYDTIAKLLK